MKKFLIILFILFLSVLSFSCSDETAEVDDYETADNSDQTIDDTQETSDNNQTTQDNQTTSDNSQTTPDSNEVGDNEVNDTTETQDKTTSDSDSEIADEEISEGDPGSDKGNEENDLDIETTDEDSEHVEIKCPENMVGLAIKIYYNDGANNINGGGTVTRNPAGTSTENSELTCYSPDTTVSLTVIPDSGFDFSQWKGKGASSLTGTFPNFAITLGTETVTLRAEFIQQ